MAQQEVSQDELAELHEQILDVNEELESALEDLQNQKSKTAKSFGEPEVPSYTEAAEYGG